MTRAREQQSIYHRYIWSELGLLVVIGQYENLLAGMDAYRCRFELPGLKGAARADAARLLAAVGLAAVSLADRESWGWTFALPGARQGYFIGCEREGMLAVATRTIEQGQTARVVVQRQRGITPVTQSHYEPLSSSCARTVEQYFIEADQRATRIALDAQGRAVLVQALPESAFQQVEWMSEEALIESVAALKEGEKLKPLGEVALFYGCRCDEHRIEKMIAGLTAKKRDELFGDLSKIDVECPRCERRYLIGRPDA